MWKMCVGSRRATTYQRDSNLQLLFEPLANLSVIELKVLRDALCDFYYDVEVNCIIGLFEEMYDKPPIAR
jgi:hypothetical protein